MENSELRIEMRNLFSTHGEEGNLKKMSLYRIQDMKMILLKKYIYIATT